MASNFHNMHRDWEDQLPPELEGHIVQQVNNLSVFGKVVELFVPNALHTAARLIGGDNGPNDPAGADGRYSVDDWRRPPAR
ncbi:MAG: hypothetical protein IT259_03285 [Saprospiraceae bacterium]|nr:hypothetical protein [Saprospiraceae bacterium]